MQVVWPLVNPGQLEVTYPSDRKNKLLNYIHLYRRHCVGDPSPACCRPSPCSVSPESSALSGTRPRTSLGRFAIPSRPESNALAGCQRQVAADVRFFYIRLPHRHSRPITTAPAMNSSFIIIALLLLTVSQLLSAYSPPHEPSK